MAARVERIAARIVERQAETEAQALAHLGDALLDLFGRQQVEPAELVVRAEIAPGRALGPLLPPRRRIHVDRSPDQNAPAFDTLDAGFRASGACFARLRRSANTGRLERGDAIAVAVGAPKEP